MTTRQKRGEPGSEAGAPVLLGLGANLGDARAALTEAARRLGSCILIQRASSVYLTAPVGRVDQPDYYNAVLLGATRLAPEELLREALQVERAMGRVRSVPNAARTVDVDLLSYGGVVSRVSELVLPHPRMHQRRFVLEPLAEIAPGWRHPVLGLTSAELLRSLPPSERGARVERVGPLR